MAELAARIAEREAGERPGWMRVTFWTMLAWGLGVILAMVLLLAPALAGLAAATPWQTAPPFRPDTPWAVVADGAVIVAMVWAATVLVRPVLGWATGVLPAWTWTAAPLAVALPSSLISNGATMTGGAFTAGLAMRFVAYRRDGSARPEPIRLTPRASAALALSIPVAAVGVATAYAVYHPLHVRWFSGEAGTGAPDRAKVTRAPLRVSGPILVNDGSRPLLVEAIEPGDERGYALHLAGMAITRLGAPSWSKDSQRPFKPFVLPAHATRDDLVMVISRAGCRPGAQGEIDSVRVRYELSGERTMVLPLDEPLRLHC